MTTESGVVFNTIESGDLLSPAGMTSGVILLTTSKSGDIAPRLDICFDFKPQKKLDFGVDEDFPANGDLIRLASLPVRLKIKSVFAERSSENVLLWPGTLSS